MGPWLYGVARRIAIRAKSDARRRIVVERHAGETGVRGDKSWIPAAPEEWSELYEELGPLPEKYRAPMVLCYLEGLTTEAAASQLGCPKGTILSRLARARERLRARLVRRGLALPAGFLALGVSLKADKATMPVTLVTATVQTAIHFSSKIVTGGEISRAIAVLAERVMRDMLLIKLKAAGGALLIVGVLATGAAVLAMQEGGPGRPKATRDHEGNTVARPIQGAAADSQEQRLSELERKFDRMLKALEAPDTDVPGRSIVSTGIAGPRGTAQSRTLRCGALRNLERRVDRLDYKLEQILKSLTQTKTP